MPDKALTLFIISDRLTHIPSLRVRHSY